MANGFGLLSIPFSNVERLRSTMSIVSLTELIELVHQLGKSPKDHPNKKKLFSVQDFFKYIEAEGRRFFEELDRDDDGEVTLEDLQVAIRKRKLPMRYFLSLMEQKEPTILHAYTSLCLSKYGTLQKSEILASLKNARLPANEDNVVSMMRLLKSDTEESISYAHFRNFMLIHPSDQLEEDPRNICFQAATVVAVAPPVEVHTGSVLKSALAGGLACALSTSVMHPIDIIKQNCHNSFTLFIECFENTIISDNTKKFSQSDMPKEKVDYDYYNIELFSSTTWQCREFQNVQLPSSNYPVSNEAVTCGGVVYFLLSNDTILRFDIYSEEHILIFAPSAINDFKPYASRLIKFHGKLGYFSVSGDRLWAIWVFIHNRWVKVNTAYNEGAHE
uniref:EF-hand domain-containing protein n=1 Tax=Lactuca sativa TaxID=4236 RepID=A0A9R1VDG4_LACSA|nr:hypothetical protein LSAT_V11C500247700 [Lactuca sativa]